MAKKIKSSLKDHPYSLLVTRLKQYNQLTSYLDYLQGFSLTIEKKLSLEDCLTDLNANFEMLNSRLFFGMQIERLFRSEALSPSTDATLMFKKYQDIIGHDITVSAISRHKLDPHCKSETDFSSAITNYKKWLLHFLFILFFTLPVEKFNYRNDDLILYLFLVQQIQIGQTISKVTVRSAPKIDASALLEIARNSELRIHQQLSNEHWAYISLPEMNTQGYVPLAYLKKII